MVLALYYLSLPAIMISHPLAPLDLSNLSVSFITAFMMELAASLTGMLFKSLNFKDSAYAEAQSPLEFIF
jgi:hypothetical protein